MVFTYFMILMFKDLNTYIFIESNFLKEKSSKEAVEKMRKTDFTHPTFLEADCTLYIFCNSLIHLKNIYSKMHLNHRCLVFLNYMP